MAQNLNRDKFPNGSLRISTGCQYCAVGCGYNAFLVPEDSQDTKTFQGVSRYITPAMQGNVQLAGKPYRAAVAPDGRCDLNKGNHSVRGGSQGHNLVSNQANHRSTEDRIKSPYVRLAGGELQPIDWATLNRIMAELIVVATDMKAQGNKIVVNEPGGLGAKVFEYQYLENTFAATKLLYSAIGTPNVAFHDRPSAAGSSPGMYDVGMRPHDFAYEDISNSDVIFFIGTNPYENQSVFFMQYCVGKEMIVLDPRETATAQYAKQTGGLHLQPKTLGADSRVAYALARAIIEDETNGIDAWLKQRVGQADPEATGYGKDWRLATEDDVDSFWTFDPAKPPQKHQPFDKRRKSRAATYAQFRQFLGIDPVPAEETNNESRCHHADELYDLATTSEFAKFTQDDVLEEAVKRLAEQRMFDDSGIPRRPRVAILYEKGAIWGFNYHNVAAIASLGVVLGAYSEEGKLVGRVGGHQKGWAESRTDLSNTFESSNWSYSNTEQGRAAKAADYSEGYPFRNATDEYTDGYLRDKFKDLPLTDPDDDLEHLEKKSSFLVQHNLDLHVFGPAPEMVAQTYEDGSVELKNGLKTVGEPDVNLLWIVGGNYLGQTNDAQRKRAVLERRMRVAGPPTQVLRPATTEVDEVIKVLSERIQAGGLVVVHQEIFPNPTTEYADLIIPAAGWGEDDLIRYNAQRRLKLYGRFQDPPIYEGDRERLEGTDPTAHWRRFDGRLHSPKPDWRIFRDIAVAIGRVMDGGTNGSFVQKLTKNRARPSVWVNNLTTTGYFNWETSAEVADDMAVWSQRGLAGASKGSGQSMLGDLLLFGINLHQQIENGESRLPLDAEHRGVVHQLLGAGRDDALAPLLQKPNSSGVGYVVAGSTSKVHGNEIATNGVLLPAVGVDSTGNDVVQVVHDPIKKLDKELINLRREQLQKIKGTLRVDRAAMGKPFCFVRACWNEIDRDFKRVNSLEDHPNAVVLTNGRFNHLWNNMFHHIRNEYVNERWPENLPGTILEINPEWAKQRGIEPGQVVVARNALGQFKAIASPQDSVASGSAFAMFSYPVQTADGRSNFDGYVNNITDGYCDGIHPIAALKYCTAVITKVVNPDDNSDGLVYPRHFTPHHRMGPSFAPRHRIKDENWKDQFPGNSLLANLGNWQDNEHWKARLAYEMREAIVRKGLPRAFLNRHVVGGASDLNVSSLFLRPDYFARLINEDVAELGTIVGELISADLMNYRENAVTVDDWADTELELVRRWFELISN